MTYGLAAGLILALLILALVFIWIPRWRYRMALRDGYACLMPPRQCGYPYCHCPDQQQRKTIWHN